MDGDEYVIEAKELVDSYVVGLEDEGDECCVVEDAGTPMVLDDGSRDNNVSVELFQCLNGGVLDPTLGMEFTSEDDARNFYNTYAKQTGFSIRVNSYYRSKKDNSITSGEFCCSKEGFRREKHARKMDSGEETRRRSAWPITREDCKALMTVRRRDNGKWFIEKLEKNHNHEMVTPAMRHFLRSHKQDYDPNNSFSDPAFYYAIQVDEKDRLSSVFWVDTRSRIAYDCFCDVVAFDTTYQVNQYKIPFAPFTGVNHHQQSVLFGCALLADETESTFFWLFTTWPEAMSRRQPGLIVTDYDSAITRTVERVFPQSTHRYCKWRIMSKMPKEMGHVYSSLPKIFQVELDGCINKTETPDEFESAWELLLDKYNLRGNEWIQSLYMDRNLRVPVYVRDVFFAGIYAAQRSGSVNSLFDGYVNARSQGPP